MTFTGRKFIGDKQLRVAEDQERPLAEGDLVIEKNDKNPSSYGVVTRTNLQTPLEIEVRWKKFSYEPDNFFWRYEVGKLIRLIS